MTYFNADAAKFRLISLEAPLTIIKLSSVIFPPTTWTTRETEPDFAEEWGLRSLISNWIWRTVSTLKDDSTCLTIIFGYITAQPK
jgi:hypothetical protein